MARVRILPDALVNKIAAGEVVERPASAVKELLENALDAGAGRIRVAVEDGGRSRIVVEDDGVGMEADDLLLALERHATSKLASEGDLFAIATLGFRGEALPSIASVSRLRLSSRPRGEAEGTSVEVSGGRFGELVPCGLFEGTRVEVRDLFFNVPARRKFLRTPATELSHVVALVEHYALARPDVAFSLKADGREVLNLAPAEGRAERFFALFPDLPREDFAEVSLPGERLAIRGLAGTPDRNFASARYQFTLVNGRFIRDRLVQHAIAQAYEDTHPRGRYPSVLLALTLPFDRVDVNVHPTKREVRFTDGRLVHDAVVSALRAAIAPGRPPAQDARPGAWPAPAWPAGSVREAAGLFAASAPSAAPSAPGAALPASPLRAIGQWRQSFIVCDSPEGLAVVDQHVAHERLRFEQFRAFLDSPGPRQPFLAPLAFALPRDLAPRTGELAEILTAQGFEAEPAGEASLVVRSAPAFLGAAEAGRLVEDFLAGAGEALKTPRDRWKEVLIMRSCRGSVMLNDPLPLEKQQYLLDALFALGAPLTCPHGRPIVFTLRAGELLARFGRK